MHMKKKKTVLAARPNVVQPPGAKRQSHALPGKHSRQTAITKTLAEMRSSVIELRMNNDGQCGDPLREGYKLRNVYLGRFL